MAAADSARQKVQDTYRRQLLQNPAFSRVFSLSLSQRTRRWWRWWRLQSCIHSSSCVFSRWWVQTAGAPQTSEIHGFFFSVENLPLCLHHALQIHIRDYGKPEIFRNAPRTFHQKTKKPLIDLEQNQLLENCIMSIILLHSFKQSLPSTSWPEMKIMFSLCNGWDSLPIDKFLNSWFENILTNLVPLTTSSKLHTSFIITLTRLEKSSYSCFKAIQN